MAFFTVQVVAGTDRTVREMPSRFHSEERAAANADFVREVLAAVAPEGGGYEIRIMREGDDAPLRVIRPERP